VEAADLRDGEIVGHGDGGGEHGGDTEHERDDALCSSVEPLVRRQTVGPRRASRGPTARTPVRPYYARG